MHVFVSKGFICQKNSDLVWTGLNSDRLLNHTPPHTPKEMHPATQTQVWVMLPCFYLHLFPLGTTISVETFQRRRTSCLCPVEIDSVCQRKGFNSDSIQTDSAIHHSHVCANPLFKQRRCIIAQGQKARASVPSDTIYIFLSLYSLFPSTNLFKQSEAVWLQLGYRGWNWIKHDWHLVIFERTRWEVGAEIENRIYLSAWTSGRSYNIGMRLYPFF